MMATFIGIYRNDGANNRNNDIMKNMYIYVYIYIYHDWVIACLLLGENYLVNTCLNEME